MAIQTISKSRIKDITGLRFGRLVAVRRTRTNKHGQSIWGFVCDCGASCERHIGAVSSGNTQSCGCLFLESATTRARKHGQSHLAEYHVWHDMLRRCNKPSCSSYSNYGGRGIKVCQRWSSSFDAFLLDVGYRPQAESGYRIDLDRRNNEGDYEPDNCRWISHIDNCNNSRRVKTITFNGTSMSQSQWSRHLGFRNHTIYNRLKLGWTVEAALTTPEQSELVGELL